MNILVSPYRNGGFYFRSDSTLIRNLTDFYAPDYIKSIAAVPVLCFRSERSGKSVPAQFAGRYLGPFTCGLVIKASTNNDTVPEEDRIFAENALDYSTIIPYDLIPSDRLDGFISEARSLTVQINGTVRASITAVPGRDELSRKFAVISRYCSLRTGDFLAFELADAVPVPKDSRLILSFGVEGRINTIIH